MEKRESELDFRRATGTPQPKFWQKQYRLVANEEERQNTHTPDTTREKSGRMRTSERTGNQKKRWSDRFLKRDGWMAYRRRVIGDFETKRKQKEIERCFYQRLYRTLSARDPKYTIMSQHAWENSTKHVFYYCPRLCLIDMNNLIKTHSSGRGWVSNSYYCHNKRPSGAWLEALKSRLLESGIFHPCLFGTGERLTCSH